MTKTTNTTAAQTDKASEPAVAIIVGDKKVSSTEVMDKLTRSLKVDSNVIKVVLLLVAYLVLLVVTSGIFSGSSLWQIANTALWVSTVISLPALYFLAKWSRIIYFARKPLSMPVSVLMAIIFAMGIASFWFIAAQAFWGEFLFILALFPTFVLFAVAYFNSFLFSLSAVYEQKNEEAMQDKIRAERFKSELITNVSHDIQTPLTSIINYTGLLKGLSRDDEEFDQKFEDYTEVLDRKSARLKTLTNDLIEASKAATGNVSVSLQTVSLTELIWQVAGEFDDQFKQRNLSFVLIPSDVQMVAHADPRHLWRVLENLFSNASKYSLEGTRVFAQLEYINPKTATNATANAAANTAASATANTASMVKLSLKNTSSEPLDQLAGELTEQFIRGDKSRHTEGSGLGLYIAKSLTELMEGELSVQVSGDQFEVTIVF